MEDAAFDRRRKEQEWIRLTFSIFLYRVQAKVAFFANVI